MAAPDRLQDRRAGPAARRARLRIHLRRQRRAALRARRELDSGRRVPVPDRPGPVPGAAAAGGRRRCGPRAGVGRGDLRERGLLRRLRRVRAAGLAGLPFRVRGLPGGAAAAGRGGGGGARERRTADAASLAGAVERQQREPVGVPGLGLGGAAGRGLLGRGLLPGRTAACGGRVGSDPAVCGGQSVVGIVGPASERSGVRDASLVGGVEPGGLRGVPRERAPVRRRVRLAGAARVRHAAAGAAGRGARVRLPGHAAPPEGRRRKRQAGAGPGPPFRRTRGRLRPLALSDAGQPGAGGRHAASSTGARTGRCARGRSCGSSTTAGR